MAKGQVTEKELASGLKGFGGFGSLGGQSKPRREDPFRDTRTELPEASVTQTLAKPEVPTIAETKPPVRLVESEVIPASAPAEKRTPAKLQQKPRRVGNATAKPAAKRIEKVAESAGATVKAELYCERVTVPLDAELRDGVESLAKDLQRKRTEKGERITANSVIRVAIRVMLENFDSGDAVVNTEDELFDALREQLLTK